MNKQRYYLLSALHNLSRHENGPKPDVIPYCQGLVVGLMSGLMARGASYKTAVARVAEYIPRDYDPARLPDTMREDIWKAVIKLIK